MPGYSNPADTALSHSCLESIERIPDDAFDHGHLVIAKPVKLTFPSLLG